MSHQNMTITLHLVHDTIRFLTSTSEDLMIAINPRIQQQQRQENTDNPM